jgi:PRTRC genetic system ThiF family protein
VIGAGGTGSLLATDLARLNLALEETGHPGMKVTIVDGDTVSKSNVGRQSFYTCDIGSNKAEVVVSRINNAYGFSWVAKPEFLKPGAELPVRRLDLLRR